MRDALTLKAARVVIGERLARSRKIPSRDTWRDKSQFEFNHVDSIRKVCQRTTLVLLVERDFARTLVKVYESNCILLTSKSAV